jgi:flavin reductase ActVB
VPISGEVYRQVGRAAAGAVSIVAAHGAGRDQVVALTVSSFVTLSFEPPLVMFAIQHHTASYAPIVTCSRFGVSLLRAGQADVARLFSGPGRDRAGAADFELGAQLQVPLVPGSLAQVECRTHEIVMGGDHAIVVGLVEGARALGGEPLLYFDRQYGAFTPLAGA